LLGSLYVVLSNVVNLSSSEVLNAFLPAQVMWCGLCVCLPPLQHRAIIKRPRCPHPLCTHTYTVSSQGRSVNTRTHLLFCKLPSSPRYSGHPTPSVMKGRLSYTTPRPMYTNQLAVSGSSWSHSMPSLQGWSTACTTVSQGCQLAGVATAPLCGGVCIEANGIALTSCVCPPHATQAATFVAATP
jgi:hypothetical protein